MEKAVLYLYLILLIQTITTILLIALYPGSLLGVIAGVGIGFVAGLIRTGRKIVTTTKGAA